MNFAIRDESPDDFTAIRSVTIDAFSGCSYGHNGEAALIEQLRTCCDPILSLVACSDNRIVGHILFTPVELRGPGRQLQGMGLAPMSVAPEQQKSGIGKALVYAGLQQLTDEGCPFVVVLGHPEYYPKLGFASAREFGVSHGFPGIPQEVFFIKPLSPEFPPPFDGWKAYFQSPFGPQHAEL